MLYWLPANRSHRYFVLPPSHIIIYHTRPLCQRRSATAYIPILYHLAFPSRTVTFILVLTYKKKGHTVYIQTKYLNSPSCISFNLHPAAYRLQLPLQWHRATYHEA